MAAKKDDGRRVVAENRQARHEYFLTDTMEAGLQLTGTEVKSLRKGQANITESYASSEDGGLWLINAYIPEYQGAGRFFQHEPRRKRRLLLHAKEIHKLSVAVERQGMTIVPLELYFNARGIAKLKLARRRGQEAARQARSFQAARLEPREGAPHAGEGVMPADLLDVDWSRLPRPEDDGGARHLEGSALPDLALPATDGSAVSLGRLAGRAIVFAYPMTGSPGEALPDGWDAIPGARGCTPQACAFRDLHAELLAAGATRVFGLSTQTTTQQSEAATRLHLPFPLLSDAGDQLAEAIDLPRMEIDGRSMLRRLTLIADDGTITKVFYPVFPPDRNAADVLAWLEANRR